MQRDPYNFDNNKSPLAENLLKSYANTESLQNYADKAEEVELEKGGKKAFIGEKREFGGRMYIKTTQGWKFFGKGTGAKAKDHHAKHATSSKESASTVESDIESPETYKIVEDKVEVDQKGVSAVSVSDLEKIPKSKEAELKSESPLKSKFDTLKVGESFSLESFLKQMGTDALSLSKEKDAFLDKKIIVANTSYITYAGSWGVPNPTYTTTYLISDNDKSDEGLKKDLDQKKAKERELAKRRREIAKEKKDDPYYRGESVGNASYSITTLRKVLKSFDKRPLGYHGSMSSTRYAYNIEKES